MKKIIVLVTLEKINFPVGPILKKLGIHNVDVEIQDSKGMKNFSFDSYKSEKYIAFFVGAVPHKTTATGKNKSLLSQEVTPSGQSIIRCYSCNDAKKPKICKASLTKALEENKEMLV